MKYLGIDPGYSKAGWGVIDDSDGTLKLIAYGVIETPADLPFPQRINTVMVSVMRLLSDFKIDYLAVEHPIHGPNVTNSVEVGAAYGAVLLAGVDMTMPTVIYYPSQVKAAVASGRADKREVKRAVKMILSMDRLPKPDDAADGLAVAICAANRRGIDEALKVVRR